MIDPSAKVTVQELAAAMIRVFEGCRLQAYADSGGRWTIGYGHTGDINGVPIDHTTVITQAQADDLLWADQAELLKAVSGRPIIEAAALVSFGYNCGLGALGRVLAGHAMLPDFVKDAHGNVLPGLVSRRNWEETLVAVSQQMTVPASAPTPSSPK